MTSGKFSTRRCSRILAVRGLYMCNLASPKDAKHALSDLFKEQSDLKDSDGFGMGLALGAWASRHRIDAKLTGYLKNWTLDRLGRVDLAILRLAAHEMLERPDIPPAVSLNEALELARHFSGPEAVAFINGVLDKLALDLQRPLRESTKPEPKTSAEG